MAPVVSLTAGVAEGSGLAVGVELTGVAATAATVGTLVRGAAVGVAAGMAPVGEEHAASASATAASHAQTQSFVLLFRRLSREF